MSDRVRSRTACWARRTPALLLLLLNPGGAWAEGPANPAAAHFARGTELARQGDLENAAAEFESAHKLSPHPTVLYNLGQTYASLGRPVDAVRALKRYLAEAAEVSSARRQEVTELVAFHEKRIGRLAIALEPADAELLVDGNPVALAGSDAPLEIAAGSHALLARKDGYLPATVTASVRPGQTAELSIRLAPAKTHQRGWLEVSCPILDANTYVDGQLMGQTPLARPLAVSTGRHEITFARVGYDSTPQRVEVEGTAAVSCKLAPSPRLTAGTGARLRVAGAPPRATILVDGQLHTGQLLPPGKHTLRVESPGHQTLSRTLTLPHGRTTVIEAELIPTREQRTRLEKEASARRRTYAYVGAGVGAALCGVAGVLYAVNSGRYNEYAADSERLSRQVSSGHATPGDLEDVRGLSAEAAAIERMDYVALSTGLLGVALLGSSVALYVSSASPDAGSMTGAVVQLKGVVW